MLSFKLYNLTDVVKEKGLYSEFDSERGSFIVDPEKLRSFFKDKDNYILEGVCSYLAPSDVVFVLRAHPSKIRKRLRARGYPRKKINENVEAEKIAYCLNEAFEFGGKVIVVDTDGKTPEQVAKLIFQKIKDLEERNEKESAFWRKDVF